MEKGERTSGRKHVRTHARGRLLVLRSVLYRGRIEPIRCCRRPRDDLSFLRRQWSSLSRSATVGHVRPRSAGKCVRAGREEESEEKEEGEKAGARVREKSVRGTRGRNLDDEEEEEVAESRGAGK